MVGALVRRQPQGGTVTIEDIQDQVELALMRAGEHKVARDYVIYRERRSQERAAEAAKAKAAPTKAAVPALNVKLDDGQIVPLNVERMRRVCSPSGAHLTEDDPELRMPLTDTSSNQEPQGTLVEELMHLHERDRLRDRDPLAVRGD